MEARVHNPVEGIEPGRLLFTAGTMGLDSGGVPGRSLEDQLDLVWSNIRVLLAEPGMTVDHIVRLTSYLREASYAESNARARVAALGGRLIPTSAIVVQTLVSDWLFEIEDVAAAPMPESGSDPA